MKTLHKSVLIWFSPQEMYDLVVGVEHYPKFLPWCDRAAVLGQTPDGMTAEVGIAFAGEPITLGMLVGFPLVIIGSYFASRNHSRISEKRQSAQAPR
jgi:hypothetical protein